MRRILILLGLGAVTLTACGQQMQMEMDWGGYSDEEQAQICADFSYATDLPLSEWQAVLDELAEEDGGPEWDAAEFRDFIEEKC